MKTEEEKIDKVIYEALSAEEAKYYDQLGEQSLLDMSLDVFKGKNKVIYMLTVVFSFIILGVFVYSIMQLLDASETKDMIIYLIVSIWCLISIAAIKLWHWMQMQTNRLLREMKRLELQVASLKDQSK